MKKIFLSTSRNNLLRCSVKKAVFKSFMIFTAKKPVLESLFDKVTGL